MTNDTSLAWDRHAELYGRLFAPLTGYIAQSMFRIAEGRLRPGAQILDIACGTGALTLPALRFTLAQHTTTAARGLVVATDFSEAMVQHTQQAAKAMGASEFVRCEVHDGEALRLPDESFDAVFSSFGIFLFGDRRAGWREASRVLRPGGVFATTVWRGPEHNAMLRAQMMPLMAALPEHIRAALPKGGWTEIAEADALASEVCSSGAFVDPTVRVFHASIALPDAQTAWYAMQNNPVMGGLLKQCTPEETAVVEKSVVQSLDVIAGGAGKPLVLDSACHILTATKR